VHIIATPAVLPPKAFFSLIYGDMNPKNVGSIGKQSKTNFKFME